jgi:hypothetical protein
MNNESKKEQQQEETKIYLTSDSTLQTPEEHKHDQQVDPRKDNTIGVSNTDLRETNIDRLKDNVDDSRETGETGL